ncbi:hypothetical protein N836_26610 [Leptolyngbya sp. Heron Island J]|uniref:hypothetical protein n=1 Tax=Leptolyngbya sp. Heron Island J TaxID=1385935 RepID=UPI0003B9754C|nr:hypothetical protein [Leptolyngbya sp. Heron Island J]ESA32166.1 hypothetical protein N836_26610 [Leptolyngbya sp. Heron Island J]
MVDQQPQNPVEQQLVESLDSQQLELVANWLLSELELRVDEGYRHPDLVWSLAWMSQKLWILSSNKQNPH